MPSTGPAVVRYRPDVMTVRALPEAEARVTPSSRVLEFGAVFVLGGVAGALLDLIHVRTGPPSYPDSTWFGQPWWVIPEMGAAALLGPFGTIVSARVLRVGVRRDVRAFAAASVWFAAAYWTSALLRDVPWLGALVLGGTWAARVAVSRDRSLLLVVSVGMAIAGTAVEMILTNAGVFSYADPQMLGVAVWLPTLYAHAALLIVRITGLVAPREPVRR